MATARNASYSDADTGVCRAELSAESYDDSNAVTGCLCFLQETVPVPEEGALWSWNEETKTLTLRDGFTLFGSPDDNAICLPDDATVLVEGRAAILFSSDDGIYCDRSPSGAAERTNPCSPFLRPWRESMPTKETC